MIDPQQIRMYLEQITPEGTILPDNPTELMNMAQQMGIVAQEGVDKMENLQEYADLQEEAAKQGQELTQTSSAKPFNLKKAQYDDYTMTQQVEETPEFQQIEQQEEIEPPFETGAEFAVWLERVGNNPTTINSIKQSILQDINNKDKESFIAEALDDYFNPGIDTASKEKVALDVFGQLDSPNWKSLNMSEQGEMMANYTTAINNTNDLIKKLAKKYANNKKLKKTSFNLVKEAQDGSKYEAILYGPSESRIDPFARQPVSDWNIVERNKGFGLVVDDVWNIDWETIWRGNIMDKYSRPYRDSKTGEWIGGYIQKRFEVDKNIPDTNNLQLKPGQLRKPYLPQYGLTEARMEEMRSKKDRGYGPVSEGKPFNWNTANSKKKSLKK